MTDSARFEFGQNWLNFVKTIDETAVRAAIESLSTNLGVTDLDGKRFLDVGCGSGLFSLAASRLGADVVSFDYDPISVAATAELRRVHSTDDGRWIVEQGSVLDQEYLGRCGQFDIVYAWGVLHHTGDMWAALENVSTLVAPGGALFIAIYNDQGAKSRAWSAVKRAYVEGGSLRRWGLVTTVGLYFDTRRAITGWLKRRLQADSVDTERPRGMSAKHDLVDWVGGYPFEVATPDEIFSFYRDRGFLLSELRTAGGGLACNQFVFRRPD